MSIPTVEPPIWQTWDFWNFMIALIALLVALYSIWYTRQRDKLSLEIIDTIYDKPEGNPYFVHFTIFNNSSTAVRITDVSLFEPNGTPASTLLGYEYKNPSDKEPITNPFGFDFKPVSFPSPYYFEAPFNHDTIIPANSSETFKYYINPFTPNMKIVVTSDKPIHRWSKQKTFLVHFVQSD